MDVHLAAAFVRHDEAEPTCRVEELDGARQLPGEGRRHAGLRVRIAGVDEPAAVRRAGSRDRGLDGEDPRQLGTAVALHDFAGDRRALAQRVVAGRLNGGQVAEHVIGPVLRLQEAVALVGMEPFDRCADLAAGNGGARLSCGRCDGHPSVSGGQA